MKAEAYIREKLYPHCWGHLTADQKATALEVARHFLPDDSPAGDDMAHADFVFEVLEEAYGRLLGHGTDYYFDGGNERDYVVPRHCAVCFLDRNGVKREDIYARYPSRKDRVLYNILKGHADSIAYDIRYCRLYKDLVRECAPAFAARGLNIY